MFDTYKAIKLPAIYEDLSAIKVVDLKSELLLITSKDPLKRALVGNNIFGDIDANEKIQILDVLSILIHMGECKPLNRPLDLLPSHLLMKLQN